MLCHGYRVERIFHRLKSRVHIAPLFVKLNEQIEGLTYLLTLGVRVLTVMEFVLRRSLEQAQASLPGLHPENEHLVTDKPSSRADPESICGCGADEHQKLPPERKFCVGSHPCQGYRKTAYNGWNWGRLSTYSLKFRQLASAGANGEYLVASPVWRGGSSALTLEVACT